MALDNLIALIILSAIVVFLGFLVGLKSSSRRKKLKKFYATHDFDGAIIVGRWNKHAKERFCFYRMVAISLDLYQWAKRDLEKDKPSDEDLRFWLIKRERLKEPERWTDFIVLPSLLDNTVKIVA